MNGRCWIIKPERTATGLTRVCEWRAGVPAEAESRETRGVQEKKGGAGVRLGQGRQPRFVAEWATDDLGVWDLRQRLGEADFPIYVERRIS